MIANSTACQKGMSDSETDLWNTQEPVFPQGRGLFQNLPFVKHDKRHLHVELKALPEKAAIFTCVCKT